MELYVDVFEDINAFNDYVNMELINEKKRVIPVNVIEVMGSDSLKVFYTIEEIEF